MLCCCNKNKVIDNTKYNNKNENDSCNIAIYNPNNKLKISPNNLKKKIKKDLIKTRTNNLIGSGTSSNVFKINIDDIFISCKVSKEKWEKIVLNEISILKKINLKQKNIKLFPEYICDFKINLNKVLCYKFIDGTDLYNFISKDNIFKYNDFLITKILFEILKGLEFLLSLNFVHLDIKPENIIIYQINPIKIKIIDLSFCSSINNKKEFSGGTLAYISPEVLFKNTYYKNTDIWSLGILASLLYDERFIFGFEDLVYVNNIKNKNKSQNIVKKKINKLKSKIMKNILSKCLKYKANNRITISSFINYIKNLKID